MDMAADPNRAARAFLAAYKGNPDGKPIYPNTIDHGYGKPLSGGTDVMRRLQNQLLHEQGSDDQKRPESPRLASASKLAEAYDCLQDYRGGGLSREEYEECLDQFKDEEDDYSYRRPTYQVPAAAGKLRILDKLLARRPDHFIQSIRDQAARGRTLSEAQLKAVRLILYRNSMKSEADTFRVASGDPMSDFIQYMDSNAVRFPVGPIGWWLPAHNMAVRLIRGTVIVMKYQIFSGSDLGLIYTSGDNGRRPTLTLAPMWWKHPRFGGNYPPTATRAQKLVGLMAHEPAVMNTVRDEMQWVNSMFNITVPLGIVTKLSMGAIKNAIVRWNTVKIRYVTIPM